MAEFDKLSKSALGKVAFKILLKKYKVLIISVISSMSALTGGFFITENVYNEKLSVDSNIAYGDTIELNEPHTIFGEFLGYEYYYSDTNEWLTEEPILPGTYKVRAISKKATGDISTSSEATFTISKKDTEILFKESKTHQTYGEYPTQSDLSLSLIDGHVLSKTPEYETLELTNTTIKLLINVNSIKIIDSSTQKDVTSCYNFKTEEKEFILDKKTLSDVKPVIADKTYDESEIEYLNKITGFESSYGDLFNIKSYVYLDASLNELSTPPTNAGTYYIKITDYEIKNDSVDTSKYFDVTSTLLTQFKINTLKVDKPIQDETTYTFISLDDSGKQTYQFSETKYYKLSDQSASLTQSDCGTYDIIIQLKNTNNIKNYEWSTGGFDNITYKFIINKQKIDNPSIDSTTFEYNDGENITYQTYESNLYTLKTSNTQTEVGSYEIIYEINDSSRYVWNDINSYVDGKTITYPFIVNKKAIDKPSLDNTTYTYDGETKTYNLTPNKYYSVSNTSFINADTYPIEIQLTDTTKYYWKGTNNDTTKLTYYFTINKATIERPLAQGSFMYGESYTFITLVDGMIQSGDSLTQSSVGVYTGTISLDSNHIWSNGTSSVLSYSFEITKNKINKPTIDNTIYYYDDGEEITYNIVESENYTITGNKKTDACIANEPYKVIVSLINKDSYTWDDGTNSDLEYDFYIYPQEIERPYNNENNIYRYNDSNKTFDIIENDSKYYDLIGSKEYTNVGSYTLEYKIKDEYNNSNYVWESSNTDEIKTRDNYKITVNVLKAVISQVGSNQSYTFDNSKHSYLLDESTLYTITNKEFVTDIINVTSLTNVYITLTDSTNYMWENTNEETLIRTFEIKERSIINPTSYQKTLDYDGKKSYTLSLVEDESSKDYYDLYLNGTKVSNSSELNVNNAGTYIVTYELKYPESTSFKNTKEDITFTINKQKVDKPTSSALSLEFNNKTQILSYDAPQLGTLYELDDESTTQVLNVGTYTVKFNIKDITNYQFSDGSFEATLTYTVKPKKIAKPTIMTTYSVPYDGEYKTFTPDDFDSDWMAISNNINKDYSDSAYVLNVSLKLNTEEYINTTWADGTSTPVSFNYYIVLNGVTPLSEVDTIHEYTGSVQYYFENLDSDPNYNVKYTVKNNQRTDITTDSPQEVVVSLYPGYKWTDDHSTSDRTYYFYIYKKSVAVPTIDKVDFDYTGSIITVSETLKTNDYYYVNNINNQVNAGTYTIELVLKDEGAKTRWNDGNSGYTRTINYNINKISLSVTTSSSTKVYDGTKLESNAFTQDSNNKLCTNDQLRVKTSSTLPSITHVGSTSNNLEFEVIHTENNIETDVSSNYFINIENGTLSITKKDVTVYPILSISQIEYGQSFTFTETTSQYSFINENTKYKVSGLKYQIKDQSDYVSLSNANTYIVSIDESKTEFISLNNVEYETDYNIIFDTRELVVTRKAISKPTTDSTTYTYNGSTQSYKLTSNDYYTVSNNSKVDAGTYKVKISLNSNYKWSDDSIADLEYDFVINKKDVKLPVAKTGLVYNGEAQDIFTIDNSASELISLEKDCLTNAGTYDVKVSLIDKDNYKWESLDTSNDQTITLTIDKASIIKPTKPTDSFTYSGSEQTFDVPTNDGYTITGSLKNTNQGTYNVVIKLKDNYKWSDNTLDQIDWSYTINKREVTIALNEINDYTFNESYLNIVPSYITKNNTSIVNSHKVVLNYQFKNSSNTKVDNIYSVGTYTCELLGATIYDESNNDVSTNYNITIDQTNQSFNVNKMEVTVVLDSVNAFTYDGSEHSISNNNLTVNYHLDKTLNYLEVSITGLLFKYGDTEDLTCIKNSGTYAAKIKSISVNDSSNYNITFSENYQDSIYTISKKGVVIPTAFTNLKYTGKSQSLLDLPDNYSDLYGVSGETGIDASDSYSVSLSLIDTSNYYWDTDGKPTTDQTVIGKISKLNVHIQPNDVTKTYEDDMTYNTSLSNFNILSKGDQILDDDKSSVSISVRYMKNNSEVDISDLVCGTYDISITVTFNNGRATNYTATTYSSTLTINPKEVTIPSYHSEWTKEYTGDPYKSYLLVDTGNYYTVTYNLKNDENVIKAGKYYVTISLNDKANYIWSNNKTDNIVLEYEITKKVITAPSLTSETIYISEASILNGTTGVMFNCPAASSYYSVKVYDSNNNEFDYSNGFKKAGTYTIKCVLTDSDNTIFNPSDFSGQVFELVVKPITISKVESESVKYSNTLVDFLGDFRNRYDSLLESSVISITGDTKGTDYGNYSFTVSINAGYQDAFIFSDNNYSYTVNSSITKANITISLNALVYDYNDTIKYNDSIVIDEDNTDLYNLVYANKDLISINNYVESNKVNIGKYVVSNCEIGTTGIINKNFSVTLNNTSFNCIIKPPTVTISLNKSATFDFDTSYDYYYTSQSGTTKDGLNLSLTYSWNGQNVTSIEYPGTYSVSSNNYTFTDSNGNDITQYVTVNFANGNSITYEVLSITAPTVNKTEYTYNGDEQDVDYTNSSDSSYYTVSGDKIYESGTYTFKAKLKYPNLTEWSSTENSSDLETTITVNQVDLTVTIPNMEKAYTGKEMVLIDGDGADSSYSNYYSDLVESIIPTGLISGDEVVIKYIQYSSFGKEPGSNQTIIGYAIQDESGDDVTCCYNDSEGFNQTITFTITTNNTVSKPDSTITTTYSGSYQTFKPSNDDSYNALLSYESNINYLKAGTYEIEVIPASGYVWSDSKDRTSVTVTWTIDPLEVTLSISGSTTYSGYSQKPNTISGLCGNDSASLYTVYSDLNKTTEFNEYMAGSYTTYLTVSTIINSINKEDVTDSYDIKYTYGSFSINKKDLTITTNTSSLKTFTYDGYEHSYNGQIVTDGLCDTDSISCEFKSLANVGSLSTKANSVEITNNNFKNSECKKNYNISYVYETLTITQTDSAVTITIPSAYTTGEGFGQKFTLYANEVSVSGLVGNDSIDRIVVDSTSGVLQITAYITNDQNTSKIANNYSKVNYIYETD